MVKIEKNNKISDKYISLMMDTTFKYLYKNEDTRHWFNKIIKYITKIDLENYNLSDNENNTGNKVKDYRYDLKFKKDKDTLIIEINDNYKNNIDEKSYQYLFREAGYSFDKGESYINSKTVLVMFNSYTNYVLPNLKVGNFVLKEKNNDLYKSYIESYEIYLPNYKEVCYNDNEEEVSLSLFSCKSYEEMYKITSNPDDIKIIKELERLSMDEEFMLHYDQEAVQRKTENTLRRRGYEEGVQDGIEKGVQQGIKEGVQQGIKEGKLNKQKEIIKNMLKDNVSVEVISRYTNVSIEKINKMIES